MGDQFRIVIHGCGLSDTDDVKVVSAGESCNSLGNLNCREYEIGKASKCPSGVIIDNPILEPNSSTELIVNITALWSDGAQKKEYTICWKNHQSTTWTTVPTHDKMGATYPAQVVCIDSSCEFSRPLSAAGESESCGCDGIVLFDHCVPWWYFLILFLITLPCCYLIYVAAFSKKNDDYEDFSMEQMQKEQASKPMMEDSIGELDTSDRQDV